MDSIDGHDLPWIVERFYGSEAINQPYQFHLEFLLMRAHLGLDDLIDSIARVRIVQADHSHRVFSGVITSAEPSGSDGGLSRYAFTLDPTTYYATRQSNSQVFQDLSAKDITDRILKRYAPHIQHRWEICMGTANDQLRVRARW